MSTESALFSRILLSMKIMSETELLELQTIILQEEQTRHQLREQEDPTQNYELRAQVALADLSVSLLDRDAVKRSLPELNAAELDVIGSALYSYLRCSDISDGTSTSIVRINGFWHQSSLTPFEGPLRKEDLSVEGRRKKAQIFRTVDQELRIGNQERALSLLDECIQSQEQAGQPTLGLELHREFTFFHQSGDYEAIISLCEQSLARNATLGNLFWQVNALGTMAFAALRMGQKQRAVSYLDQIETRLRISSPDDIARTTVYFDESESRILSLLQGRLKTAQQLRQMLIA